MSNKDNVQLKKYLLDKIQKVVDKSDGEFKSVEEYIEFFLTEIIKDDEEVRERFWRHRTRDSSWA